MNYDHVIIPVPSAGTLPNIRQLHLTSITSLDQYINETRYHTNVPIQWTVNKHAHMQWSERLVVHIQCRQRYKTTQEDNTEGIQCTYITEWAATPDKHTTSHGLYYHYRTSQFNSFYSLLKYYCLLLTVTCVRLWSWRQGCMTTDILNYCSMLDR